MAKGKRISASARPRFGRDYDLGWVGFVHAAGLLSRTIGYLTRWDRSGAVTVSHTFLVTGQDQCIEANFPAGVVTTRLSEEYFGRDDRLVLFRKPRGLTPGVARRLVRRARAQLGAGFDFGVFVNDALHGSFVGHLFNALFRGRPQEMMDRLLSRKGRWVCSELVAYCLQEESRFRGKGILARPPGTIEPQALFEDEELFEPLPAAALGKPRRARGSSHIRDRSVG